MWLSEIWLLTQTKTESDNWINFPPQIMKHKVNLVANLEEGLLILPQPDLVVHLKSIWRCELWIILVYFDSKTCRRCWLESCLISVGWQPISLSKPAENKTERNSLWFHKKSIYMKYILKGVQSFGTASSVGFSGFDI